MKIRATIDFVLFMFLLFIFFFVFLSPLLLFMYINHNWKGWYFVLPIMIPTLILAKSIVIRFALLFEYILHKIDYEIHKKNNDVR